MPIIKKYCREKWGITQTPTKIIITKKTKYGNITFDYENNLCYFKTTPTQIIIYKKKVYLGEKELFDKTLERAELIECKINNETINRADFTKLRNYIYTQTDKQTLVYNNICGKNVLPYVKNDKGYKYHEKIENTPLHISIKNYSTKDNLKIITRLCKLRNFSIQLKIKLYNDEVVRYKQRKTL